MFDPTSDNCFKSITHLCRWDPYSDHLDKSNDPRFTTGQYPQRQETVAGCNNGPKWWAVATISLHALHCSWYGNCRDYILHVSGHWADEYRLCWRTFTKCATVSQCLPSVILLDQCKPMVHKHTHILFMFAHANEIVYVVLWFWRWGKWNHWVHPSVRSWLHWLHSLLGLHLWSPV